MTSSWPSTGARNLSPEQITRQISSHHCTGTPVQGCKATTPVTIEVKRSGQLKTFSIVPFYDVAAQAQPDRVRARRHCSAPIGPITASGQSVSQMWYVTKTTVSTIARLFEPKVRKQLHGVVGGFTVTQERFAFDTTEALYTLALISLSLAVVNLFPFLPLDGGHVFWALAEKVRGRRIPFAVMERVGAVGFVLILLIFVIGLSNDITTLTGKGFQVR